MPTVQDNGATYVFRLEEGHPLHAGPGVQGQAARAHRRRSRLRHQAPARPRGEEPMAVAGRRQDRRRRRGARQGHQDRPLRLRRADPGPRGRRPLHAADSPHAARSAIPLCARGAEHGGRGARSGRGVRARLRRASGGNGPVHARRIQAQREDRARRQSGLPADDVRARRSRAAGVAAGRGGAQGQEAPARPAASRRASSRKARRNGSRSSTARSICSSGCRPTSSTRRSPTAS